MRIILQLELTFHQKKQIIFFCLEDIYSFYSLMDSAADMAEEQGLQQATLRDMKR